MSVQCLTDGRTWYSQADTSRAVQELLFGGYALYERVGSEGFHRGIADWDGAEKWLKGEPLADIEHYMVPGVTVVEDGE